jgi:hypothetical protein
VLAFRRVLPAAEISFFACTAPAVFQDAEHAPGRGRCKGTPSAFGCAGPPRLLAGFRARLNPVAFASASKPPSGRAYKRRIDIMSRRDIHAESPPS